jgi:hypothetical protein
MDIVLLVIHSEQKYPEPQKSAVVYQTRNLHLFYKEKMEILKVTEN